MPHSSEQVAQPQAADLMTRNVSLADIIEQNNPTKDNNQKRPGKAQLSPAALQQVEAAAQQRQREQIRFRYGIDSREERAFLWKVRTGGRVVDYDSDDDSQAGDASLPVQFDGELARELQEQETEQVISKEQQLLADQQAAEQLQEQLRQALHSSC